MVTFPKYESYKDSGIEWADEIPQHWNVSPLRAIFQERKEKNIGSKTDFILSVMKDKGIIPYDEKGNVGNKKSENIENYKLVYPGDLVVNKMNAIIGSLGISQYHGALSQVYFVLYPRDKTKVDKDYFGYLFQVKPFQKSLIKICRGIMELRESIEFNEFKKLPLLLPPVEEQKRIVEFLDRKTSEIDQAIAQKQRLIELLQEQKAILINQAVTKGLDPNVPMCDRGIDWLGNIPKHWDTRKGKFLFKQSHLPVRNVDDVVTAYRDGEVTLRTNRRIDGYTVAILEQGYQGVRIGQLVINSMDAFAGAIGISDSEGKCSPEYVVCDPVNFNVEPAYYALLLREMALQGYIEVICPAVRQRGLRIRYNSFAQLLLPLPPKKEQQSIVQKVSKTLAKSNEVILYWQKEINLLKEFKNIVISLAVTGKIKF